MPAITRNLTTTWTEPEVRQLVASQGRPFYQQIELPYGLRTQGEDRTATSQLIFPADLSDLSVLDVGCQIGHFCHDACHLGARRVLGLDINAGALEEARQIARCLGHPATFRLLDIEREGLDEQFDLVLCLNLMQHFKNPLLVLDKLVTLTRRQLILELPSFGRRDCRRLGVPVLLGKLLDRLPVLYAGPTGVNGAFYSPKFGISAAALRNILLAHRNQFARVDAFASQFKQRYIAIAHKRRFGRLLLLGGAPCSGRHTLVEALRSGAAPQVASRLDLGKPADWRLIEAAGMARVPEPCIDRAIVPYDLLNPCVRRCRTFERDELLDPVGLADRVACLTLWAQPRVLLERFDRAASAAAGPRGRPAAPGALEQRRLLADPARLLDEYRAWLAYLARFDGQPLIADTTEGLELLDRCQWERRAGAPVAATAR